ncbi:MAG: UDP-2,3-diacylglucosamine diphosphatase [Syntrophales bacterium]
MKAIFLADAHLKREKDTGYRYLMRFFDLLEGTVKIDKQETEPPCYETAGHPISIDNLFIVGDFFDFWFCKNNHIYPEFRAIISKLIELKMRGIRIHFCEGNHDFFMKNYFSRILGMTVSTEWKVFDFDDQRVLVSHGDTIDRLNIKYLLLRKILRSTIFYRVQQVIPSSLLWGLARISSNISKELSSETEDKLVEKMLTFSLKKFREGFDTVILGHCHKPFLKEYTIDERRKTFATTGDWIKRYSYLYYEDGRFTLSYYKP